MGTDFRELAEKHYQRYEQHKAKEAEYRANGPSSKELAETEERLAASAYSAYRAARDCIS